MEPGNFLFVLGLTFTECLPRYILPFLMTKLDFPTLNFTPVSLFKVNETEDETEEKKNDIQSVRKKSVLANSANGYTEKYGPKIRKNG